MSSVGWLILYPLLVVVALVVIALVFNRVYKAVPLEPLPLETVGPGGIGSVDGLPSEARNGELVVRDRRISYHFTPLIKGRHGSPPTLKLVLEAPLGRALFLSRERVGDRFLRSLGLSREILTGHADFDRLFHVVGEDELRTKLLIQESRARDVATELGRLNGFQFLSFRDRSLTLYVTEYLLAAGQTFEQGLQAVADRVAELHVEAERVFGALPGEATAGYSRRFDLFEASWPPIYLLSSFFSVALLFLFLNVDSKHAVYITDALALFGVASLFLSFLLVALFRRRIQALQLPSKVLNPLLMGTIAWNFSFLVGVLFLANTELDRSPSREAILNVQSKFISYGKNRSRTYHVILDAPTSPILSVSPDIDKTVSFQIFDGIREGQTTASVRVHDGALGVPWYDQLVFRY